MKCMRCARETAPQQVFCNACLEDMARYPVRSDTPIYLPVRKPKEAPRKKSRRFRRERTAEEMVMILRKRVKVLIAKTDIVARRTEMRIVEEENQVKKLPDKPLRSSAGGAYNRSGKPAGRSNNNRRR